MYRLWKTSEEYLKNKSTNNTINADELSKIWSSPPFGIKNGLHTLIFFIFILTKQKNIALYHENIYVPAIDETIIDYMIKRNLYQQNYRFLQVSPL